MKYCPPVPFRPDLVYCYPEIKLQSYDIWGLLFLMLVAVVAIILYLIGRAK
jgi:hypothetical protein